MLRPSKPSVAMLGRAVLLAALAAAAPAMADGASHTGRVSQLMELVGLHQTLATISDALVAADSRLDELPGEQRACVIGVTVVTLEDMMRERLAERMTASEVQHWLDFAATSAGRNFVAVFASSAQAHLASGGGAQPRRSDPEYAVQADAFMGSAAFMALANALMGQPTFNYRQSKYIHQRFQSDCGVSSPQDT